MLTYDQQVIDSTGVFLIGQLERLDQTLHMPLAAVSWSRDVQLREDVSIADEVSSFTNSSFAAAGGPSPNGKSFIGKDSTAIEGIQLDIGKTTHPLTLWGMQLGWTLPELMSAQKLGRPVDQQKYSGMQLKYQMDLDEMVYIGDDGLGATGLLNDSSVATSNAPNGNWTNGTTTADQILDDINNLLESVWEDSAYAVLPRELRVPPLSYGKLVTTKVSSAGNISVLNYVAQNSLCNSVNGTPLNIQPLKWLTGRGAAGANRMVAYTNEQQYVRYPLVPLQRTPLEYRDIRQLTTYFGRFGQLEVVYPETMGYSDGI